MPLSERNLNTVSPELKPQRRAIPAFARREEEAAFWDSHSIADYWESADPAEVSFGHSLSRGLTIRRDPETLVALRAAARLKGMGPTTLARSWILERLAQPSPVRSGDS